MIQPSPRDASRQRQGFTLLEMLVVIALIGVLTGLLLPFANRARRRGQSAVCLSNLRQIGLLLSDYTQRHGVLPVLYNRGDREEPLPAMDIVLPPHPNETGIFRCPADRDGIYQETGTSYFWNFLANGQSPDRLRLLGAWVSPVQAPLVADKEPWHHDHEDRVNTLYADGHVTIGLRDFQSR